MSQDELTALLCIALEIHSKCIDLREVIKHQTDDSVIGSLCSGQKIQFNTFRDLLPVCSNDVVTPSIGQFYVYLMDVSPDPKCTSLNKLLDNVKFFVVPYCTRICRGKEKHPYEAMVYSCECALNDAIAELRKLLNILRRDIVDADDANTDVHKLQALADEASADEAEEADDKAENES